MEEINEIKSLAKYEVVKRYILSLVESGQLNPEDKIPMECDLAKQFNVSITTTRKALCDLVNAGIIYRVKKRGTFVSSKALEAKSNREKMISFVLPLNNRSDNNLLQFVHGAQDYLSKAGYPMLIEATNDSVEIENNSINNAITNQLSGLIIFPISPIKNTAYFLKLKSKNIPFVLIDRYPDDLPVSAVTCNNVDGAFQATEHLIKLNHTKIAFVPFIFENQAEQLRYKGYQLALKTYGIEIDENEHQVYSLRQKEEICEQIKQKKITALVCASDYCALEIVDYLKKQGVNIPSDVSVIGFDGQKATKYVTPPLTTVVQPCFEIGEKAAKTLVEMIESGYQSPNQSFLPVKLKVRGSTAEMK